METDSKEKESKEIEPTQEIISLTSENEGLLNMIYPIEDLKVLALCYLMFFDTFTSDFSFSSMKKVFKENLQKYSEEHMQRFNITTVAGEQVTQALETQELEGLYSLFTQNITNVIESEHKDIILDKLVSENEITDYQIKTKVQEFLDSLKLKLKSPFKKSFGYISLISTNKNARYFYYFHCNIELKTMVIFKTNSKRKIEKELLNMFQKVALSLSFKLTLLEDVPRNFLASNCPDVFMAFILQKIIESGMKFEDALRMYYYNMVPFIIDENDIIGDEIQDDSQQPDENCLEGGEESDDFNNEPSNKIASNQIKNEENKKRKQDEDEDDVNFDDDDFDDICDDF